MGELLVIALSGLIAWQLHGWEWYRRNVEDRFGFNEE